MTSRAALPVSLVLALLTTSCAAASGDDATRDALVDGLRTAATANTEMNLADVVDGDWNGIVFVCPYEGEREVEDRLGFAWKDFPGRDDSEGLTTFIFASAEDVTTWATIGRNLGDPCGSSAVPSSVPRTAALFRVEQTDSTSDGRPFYTLVQRRRPG